ncbi:MAG: xanthine dehydrogenase family protein subunit M [Alicyclobacillus sp.]|nr:xanthine dehydrogenase family protein subunit M [Alicyclobacillus sp.]
MKPSHFHYLRPQSLEEALEMLQAYGEDAKVLAGGQSLIPLLNMRLATPKYIIDIGGLDELRYIREAEGQVRIGALTRHVDVEKSGRIAEACPLLGAAVQRIGHSQIRNRGTVGGSIAHGDASAELPCVLAALRGEVRIQSTTETRVAAADTFFLTYMMTDVQPTELVTEVRFPVLPAHTGWSFQEFARRHGDFAMVTVAAAITLDGSNRIAKAQVAVGGAGPVPTVLTDLEEAIVGEEPSSALFESAAAQVGDVLEPDGDLHGTPEYRVQLAQSLVRRALDDATSKVGGAFV